MTPPRVETILVVDDNHSEREAIVKILTKEDYQVLEAPDGNLALDILKHHTIHLILTDLRMPQMDGEQLLKASKLLQPNVDIVIISAHGTIEKAVELLKTGASDFLTKPFKKAELLRTLKHTLERQNLILQNRELTQEVERLRQRDQLIGKCLAFQKTLELAQQVAPSEATVLITGESGTGKELFADLIHRNSLRKEGPFIKVNCAAIPENLLESEFFGHERGSFTGAISQKQGRFELAHHGTLFLDEIAEMTMALQAKLLRILQSGEFERVGGTKTLKADVRVVAATNQDLKKAVAEKNFREDLYYRLNVISLKLPPLRERAEDIPLIASHFIQRYKEKNKKEILGISPEAVEFLMNYSWPGNIRELENIIERAIVVSREKMLSLQDFPSDLTSTSQASNPLNLPLGSTLAEIERYVIQEMLRRTHGDKETTAKILGISSRTIYRRLEEEEL